MSEAPGLTCTLRELAAPAGWTGAWLEAELPLEGVDRGVYRQAVRELREAVAALVRAPHQELFLLFERCRPEVEIPLLQRNARWWLPEIGMGVSVDREPPTTWSTEEFVAAKQGTLRPVIDRVLRLTRDPKVQESAWDSLLGSGALFSASLSRPELFLERATEFLQPRISDPSLTSFPFYAPLLSASTLSAPSPAFHAPFGELLPDVEVYCRESVEDRGFFLLVRQEPRTFWSALLKAQMPSIDVLRPIPLGGR